MLFSWLMACGTAACSSVSAPPPSTGSRLPSPSRSASSNTWAFSTVTVSASPAGTARRLSLQLKQVL